MHPSEQQPPRRAKIKPWSTYTYVERLVEAVAAAAAMLLLFALPCNRVQGSYRWFANSATDQGR